MATYIGAVKTIPEGKSFGFIKSPTEPKDFFFHKDDCLCDWNTLVRDFRSTGHVKVEFEAERGNKGLRAKGIRRP